MNRCVDSMIYGVIQYYCTDTTYLFRALQGLKTGMYYLRTKPAANAIQFTVDKAKLRAISALNASRLDDSVSVTSEASSTDVGSFAKPSPSKFPRVEAAERDALAEKENARLVCSLRNPEGCTMCQG